MDDNPYPAPHASPRPPTPWSPLLWPIAATFGLFFLMCGMALLAAFVHHVLLFSIAVVLLIVCTAVGIDARFKGKMSLRWPTLRLKTATLTDEQAARLRFWLPFFMGSIMGVILSFFVAPYLQVLLEVVAGVRVSTLWIGIAGSIIEVAIYYAAACLFARRGNSAESLREAESAWTVGPWSGD